MNRNWRSGFCLAVLGGVIMLGVPAWAGTGGQLMQLTMQIQERIAGMAALPAHTVSRQVCMQPGAFDAKALAHLQSSSQCKITHFEKQGDVVTFDQVCAAPQAVTNHGEFHLTGDSDFTGTMRTSMEAAGHAVTVDTAYTGKKVGSCDPEQQASR